MITPEMIKGLLVAYIAPELKENEMFSVFVSKDRKSVHVFKCEYAAGDGGKIITTALSEVNLDALIAKAKESISGISGMSDEDKKAIENFNKTPKQ